MAMNIPSNIRQVRGTSAQVQNVSADAGSLFYDTERELFLYSAIAGNETIVRAGNVGDSRIIYVDANNGSDDNSGITVSSPLKTFDKAVYIANTVFSRFGVPTIQLASGVYNTDLSSFPDNLKVIGSSKDDTVLNCGTLAMSRRFFDFSSLHLHIVGSADTKRTFAIYGSEGYFRSCKISFDVTDIDYLMYIGDVSYLFVGATDIDGGNTSVVSAIYITYFTNFTITGTGASSIANVTCSTSVCEGTYGAQFVLNNNFIDGGNVTGKRYKLLRGATVQSIGKGVNAIPGTEAGTVDASTGAAYY